jgi:hypothetical protein
LHAEGSVAVGQACIARECRLYTFGGCYREPTSFSGLIFVRGSDLIVPFLQASNYGSGLEDFKLVSLNIISITYHSWSVILFEANSVLCLELPQFSPSDLFSTYKNTTSLFRYLITVN